jgi:PhnB protein
VHAELRLGDSTVTLAEEHVEWHNCAPPTLGGSSVILNLEVDDADALGARMVLAGSRVVFPIADQFYGKREGRVQDPFGHLWLISQKGEPLSAQEIQRRIAQRQD